MFDPSTGRFVTPDPIGFEAGDPNLYRYCFNDPINNADPSGNRLLASVCPYDDQNAGAMYTAQRVWDNSLVFFAPMEKQDASSIKLGMKFLGLQGTQSQWHQAWMTPLDLFDAFPPSAWASFQQHRNAEGPVGTVAKSLAASVEQDVVVNAYPGGTDWELWDDYAARRFRGWAANAELNRRVDAQRNSWQSVLAGAVSDPQAAAAAAGRAVTDIVSQAGATAVNTALAIGAEGTKILSQLPNPLTVGLARVASLLNIPLDDLLKAIDLFGATLKDSISTVLLRGDQIFKNVAKTVGFALADFCGAASFDQIKTKMECPKFGEKMLKVIGDWLGGDFIGLFTAVVNVVGNPTTASLAEVADKVAGIFGLNWDGVLGLVLKAVTNVGGGNAAQSVLTVVGILDQMSGWLGVPDNEEAAGEPPDNLGQFVTAILRDPQKFFEEAADKAANLPWDVWLEYWPELLKELAPELALFAATMAAKLDPTGVGAVISWAKTAYDFYTAIRANIERLEKIIAGVRDVVEGVLTSPAGDDGRLQSLGATLSKVFQTFLPVVLDVLAAALGVLGIKNVPAKAVGAVKMKIEPPVLKTLEAIARPVVKGLAKLIGGGNTPLTEQVKLTKDMTKTAWLAKTGAGVRVFIGPTPERELPVAESGPVKKLIDIGEKIGPLVAPGAKLTGKQGRQLLALQKKAATLLMGLDPSGGGCMVSLGRCFARGTTVRRGDGSAAGVEKVPVGGRVATWRPGEAGYADSLLVPGAVIDPDGWRVVSLVQEGEALTVEARLLRPLAWLEACGAFGPRGKVVLDLPEMGAVGRFEVMGVGPCPPIESGPGRVVTGVFRHSRGAVYNLVVDGESGPVGMTEGHPVWSPDRRGWVPASGLLVGERVSVAGGLVAVMGWSERSYEPVFNLEVDADHCYRVGEQGILVHNASCPTAPSFNANTEKVKPSWWMGGKVEIDRTTKAVFTVVDTYEGRRDLDTPSWWEDFQTATPVGVGDRWEKGHLMASLFGGPSWASNLVPLHQEVNISPWSKCEKRIENALCKDGCVQVTVTVHYPSRSTMVPDYLVIRARGKGTVSEFSLDETILNIYPAVRATIDCEK